MQERTSLPVGAQPLALRFRSSKRQKASLQEQVTIYAPQYYIVAMASN